MSFTATQATQIGEDIHAIRTAVETVTTAILADIQADTPPQPPTPPAATPDTPAAPATPDTQTAPAAQPGAGLSPVAADIAAGRITPEQPETD